jgi:aspartate-semialdehyde dehydrogenase
MKVAVIGATGLVGQKMLQVLQERRFPVSELLPVASERSLGRLVEFAGRSWPVMTVPQALKMVPDIALFSAGAAASLEFAPLFAKIGSVVIDNSSAWRMDPMVPLIVPEVNGGILIPENRLIANPNCSTIQMVMVLNPLARTYGIRRVVVSTYQAVSGTGVDALRQLEGESNGKKVEKQVYPHPINRNCIPQCDVFTENGYTKEEMKMILETRKIMRLPKLQITATCVRVPVVTGHSESVNVDLESPYNLDEIRELLGGEAGLRVVDDVENRKYPMPIEAADKDEVFVGRIRRDDSLENGLNLWIVSDNLRKGAATNAVQIAELVCTRYETKNPA